MIQQWSQFKEYIFSSKIQNNWINALIWYGQSIIHTSNSLTLTVSGSVITIIITMILITTIGINTGVMLINSSSSSSSSNNSSSSSSSSGSNSKPSLGYTANLPAEVQASNPIMSW